MRVAFVKQALDADGPWRSLPWTAARDLLAAWVAKPALFPMAALLEADVYVVSDRYPTLQQRNILRRIPHYPEIVARYVANIIPIADIPFDAYDLVFSEDPILRKMRTRAVLAYFVGEHACLDYERGKIRPHGTYDVMLAHNMDAPGMLLGLPQAVAFPYMRHPDLMRELYPGEHDRAAWVDLRTLAALAGSYEYADVARVGQQLAEALDMPVRHIGETFLKTRYLITDPPLFGQAAEYYGQMASCRYYIGVMREQGAGQAITEAASLGCICVGRRGRPYHKRVCHSSTLCNGIEDARRVIARLEADAGWRADVLRYQDTALREHFVEKPLAILRRAVELKQK